MFEQNFSLVLYATQRNSFPSAVWLAEGEGSALSVANTSDVVVVVVVGDNICFMLATGCASVELLVEYQQTVR
jgi:hypothetical protein